MNLVVISNSNHGFQKALTRCPNCGKEVVFENIGQSDVKINDYYVCGQRKCPNPNCNSHLFVVFQNGVIVVSYPPDRVDFNNIKIPERIITTFEEALTCHSLKCHVASAIMIRRTLEEICKDKNSKGDNLKIRIKNLQKNIILPQELLDAMDELRILGNNAAHIEAKEFEEITNKEIDVAIEVTKEILKGLYQYSDLLDKIRSLKNNA